jgi:hypothetical protein
LRHLWTDDPEGFLDTVCPGRRHCEARLDVDDGNGDWCSDAPADARRAPLGG